MDEKLQKLIEAGKHIIECLLDGVYHIKEVETGKICKWIDGELSEIEQFVETKVEEVTKGVVAKVKKAFGG